MADEVLWLSVRAEEDGPNAKGLFTLLSVISNIKFFIFRLGSTHLKRNQHVTYEIPVNTMNESTNDLLVSEFPLTSHQVRSRLSRKKILPQ